MMDEALRWFDEALWDYETAEILHREKRYNASAFYAHQAAEKAAKALLYHVNEAPWGDSIRVLLERFFRRMGRGFDPKLLTYARELDRYYIPSDTLMPTQWGHHIKHTMKRPQGWPWMHPRI